jgi:hypothetical protein
VEQWIVPLPRKEKVASLNLVWGVSIDEFVFVVVIARIQQGFDAEASALGS